MCFVKVVITSFVIHDAFVLDLLNFNLNSDAVLFLRTITHFVIHDVFNLKYLVNFNPIKSLLLHFTWAFIKYSYSCKMINKKLIYEILPLPRRIMRFCKLIHFYVRSREEFKSNFVFLIFKFNIKFFMIF